MPDPRPNTLLIVSVTALITVPATVAVTLWWAGGEPAMLTPATTPVGARSAATRLAAPGSVAPGSDAPLGESLVPGAGAALEIALATPVPAPDLERTGLPWAPPARRVAATDLDGDGVSEIVFAGPDLQVFDTTGRALARAPGLGGIDVLEAFGGAVYAGWGRDKAAPANAPPPGASVVRYTLGGRAGAALVTESIVSPESSRPQIVAISQAGGELLVAWFFDKYSVTARRVSTGASGWTLAPVADARTAPVWLSTDLTGDGVQDVIYGRTYGDETGSPGDAWLLPGAGGADRALRDGLAAPIAIPTTGGVRAGCLADTNGDGKPEVVLADGWDKDYGRKAHAQIRLVTWADGAVHSTILDRSPGDYDVSRLIAADLDGDGKDEILAVTNSRLRVLTLGASWVAWDTAPGLKDAAVALDARGAKIIVLGPLPESVRLRR